MKNKFLALLMVLVLALSCFFTACGRPSTNNGDSTSGSGSGGSSSSSSPSGTPSQEINLPRDIPVATEPSIQIHYRRNTVDYDAWCFWLWDSTKEGAIYTMNYCDDFGAIALYPLSTFFDNFTGSETLGIIPRRLDSWTKDGESDRFVNFADYEMDADNYYHVYIKQGDIELYKTSELKITPKITQANFVSETKLTVSTTTPINYYEIYENGELIGSKTVNGLKWFAFKLTDVDPNKTIDLGSTYTVKVRFSENNEFAEQEVSIKMLYSTAAFNDAYYYDGELGAIFTKESTTFRVWSPISSQITLNLYKNGNGGNALASHEMTKGEKGVFEVTVSGDLEGLYYTYTVVNSSYPSGAEIVDPYAKSAGLDGVRGQIVNFENTNPEGWDSVNAPNYDRKELTVWETHVADVTSSSTWGGTAANSKKFLGLIETGTTYTQGGVTVSTGFDHIKELGVNAVQFVPIFDQANKEANPTFNWGYNPLNYNVLEGSYSSDPTNGYVRINEFKQVVQAYNQAGIGIIMDVVYNHVNSAKGSNFDVLMPGYYFRYASNGSLSNGSGCGNETASENAMFRKFMIDSACFWAKEYKLSGFRFDLMGLHDIETMNLLTAELKKINPNIVVYGEPWRGGDSPLESGEQAVQANANYFEGYGQFNDQMRDALIKGGLSAASERGWVTTNGSTSAYDFSKITEGIKGNTKGSVPINDANKTVNYVTCHDNYTLYDRARAAGITDEATIRKMCVLANAVVLTSRGTTFILAGEEFLRTKGGDHNSYDSGYAVNELDYSLKVKNLDVFNNYKALIGFRKTMSAFHVDATNTQYQFTASSLNGNNAILISFVENGESYKIVHANGSVDGLTVDLSGYTLVLDTLGYNDISTSTTINPYQTIIVKKPA